MALSLEIGKDNIEVVSSHDPSIGVDAHAPYKDAEGNAVVDGKGAPVTVYQRYLETLDEALLQLKEGETPTRFVMRRMLPFGMAQKIKTEQAGTTDDGKVEVRMGFIMHEIRAALVGVTNPGSKSLEFKLDSDGYASKPLVALLEAAGITNELYAARQNATVKAGGPSKKS